LIFGTFLTLILVPVLYLLVAKLKAYVFKNRTVEQAGDEAVVAKA
jgi:multidrug efflux pump